MNVTKSPEHIPHSDHLQNLNGLLVSSIDFQFMVSDCHLQVPFVKQKILTFYYWKFLWFSLFLNLNLLKKKLHEEIWVTCSKIDNWKNMTVFMWRICKSSPKLNAFSMHLQRERERGSEHSRKVRRNHTSPFSYCIAKSAAMKNVCQQIKRFILEVHFEF